MAQVSFQADLYKLQGRFNKVLKTRLMLISRNNQVLINNSIKIKAVVSTKSRIRTIKDSLCMAITKAEKMEVEVLVVLR